MTAGHDTQPVCDCHLHEHQVCDICQGVADGAGHDNTRAQGQELLGDDCGAVIGVKNYDATVPKPDVKSQCKVCALTYIGHVRWTGVVSPRGIEHIAVENGDTLCGKNATGDAWWWPL